MIPVVARQMGEDDLGDRVKREATQRELPEERFTLEYKLLGTEKGKNPFRDYCIETGNERWPTAIRLRLGEQYLDVLRKRGSQEQYNSWIWPIPGNLLSVTSDFVEGGGTIFPIDEGGFHYMEITGTKEKHKVLVSFYGIRTIEGKYEKDVLLHRALCDRGEVAVQFLKVYNQILYDLIRYGENGLLTEQLKSLRPDPYDKDDRGYEDLFYRFRERLTCEPFIVKHADVYKKVTVHTKHQA